MTSIPYHPQFKPAPRLKKIKKPRKANNKKVDSCLLEERINFSSKLGFGKQKWVEFCEAMMRAGFDLYLYEARQTVSKYVTVTDGEKEFKVRFSNHKPNKGRETRGDCDFFVGITHTGVRTTGQAIMQTLKFFNRI